MDNEKTKKVEVKILLQVSEFYTEEEITEEINSHFKIGPIKALEKRLVDLKYSKEHAHAFVPRMIKITNSWINIIEKSEFKIKTFKAKKIKK